MKSISTILRERSNASLATITGYPVEFIKMLRKNDIDHYAIRTDKTGRGIPTRGVMENIIEERVDQYENQIKHRRTSISLLRSFIPRKDNHLSLRTE